MIIINLSRILDESGCTKENIVEFKRMVRRLKEYYRIPNLFVWNYNNLWWLMIDHKTNAVCELPRAFVEFYLKKNNKIEPELSDLEFKVQYALGVVAGKFYILYE